LFLGERELVFIFIFIFPIPPPLLFYNSANGSFPTLPIYEPPPIL
jgi:hypothetical protein